ncbi:hypothetical protein [Jatrophihabitans sp.]|uniref:hypothetical protein n=1 Tax=Jatrophihabitans sp. TaxID=1932789 RepID=UPI0030C76C66
MRRLVSVVTTLVAFATLGAVPAYASGSSGSTPQATFGIQAATGDKADARPNFQFGGGPGSAPFHDTVSVLNIGDVPLTLSLYPADAQTTSDGQFGVKLQSQKQDDVGSWIKLAQGPTVVVAARTAAGATRVFVPFTLTIPRTATPGDHVGAIILSLRTKAGSSGRANEALDRRVGIRVYVRVSGTIHAALSVQHLRAVYRPQFQANPFGTGRVTVSYVVRNTGNVILGARQQLSVSGLLGGSRAVTLSSLAPLLPGNSALQRAVVTGVFPEFRETAKVTLHPLPQVGAVDAPLRSVSSSTGTWAVPWLLIILVVIVLSAGYWYLRRRLSAGGTHSAKRPAAVAKGGSR